MMQQQAGLPAQSTIGNQPVRICDEVESLTAVVKEMEDLYQNAPCGFHSVDRNRLILKINDTELRWLGYQRDEVVGKLSVSDLICTENHAALTQSFAGLLAGEALHAQKFAMRRKNGESFRVIANVCVLQDAGGNPVMTWATLLDISEREQMDAALRESEQRLQGVIESAMDAIITVDDGLRVVLFNPAAIRMFGVPDTEAIGFSLDRFMPTRFRKAHAGHVQTFGREGRTVRSMGKLGQIFGLRANGEEFPVEATISQIEINGKNLYTVIMRDITERKQAEAALQLSHEKLHELVAHQERIKENERIRIAREIHDELGSVLTGIKANLSVAIIQDERAGRVPNQLLLDAYTQLDAAVDTVRKVITDLRPSVLDNLGVWTALEWYAEQTEARTGLRCRVAIDASAAESVIDAERSTALFRILQETLTNVTRHADASQVEIRVMHEDGSIRMEVEDNGKGINAEQIPNRKSWGIQGMAERARYFGGDIRIADTSHGTLVALRLPLEKHDG